jgi:hypothetical protein
MDEYDEKICQMLKNKEDEMLEFINRYMSKTDINRIGEDIIRIMPCRGDIAKIKLDILIEGNLG